jgi:two-component system C4-dicarboxylate transport sensor histidine kinase DctB
MADPEAPPATELRLLVYVGLGVALGVAYVLFDALSESRIGAGTLTGRLAELHAIVDRASPIIVGALLGVCAHYLRLRSELTVARAAAGRAERLHSRLEKVERDQAVWVLSAAVLHELNNPLHALRLLLDELAATGEREPRGADLLARAQSQADRALAHLRRLRSVGVTGEPRFERVALDTLLEGLAAEWTSLVAKGGLEIRVECQRGVHASVDPTYVRTILENLFDNSFGSLRDRGRGCITLGLVAEGGRAVVRVADDGPPLAPGVRDSIFEPLRTTKAQGLGLGLPIARALARAMRGDVALEDGEPKTFRLELPLREAP